MALLHGRQLVILAECRSKCTANPAPQTQWSLDGLLPNRGCIICVPKEGISMDGAQSPHIYVEKYVETQTLSTQTLGRFCLHGLTWPDCSSGRKDGSLLRKSEGNLSLSALERKPLDWIGARLRWLRWIGGELTVHVGTAKRTFHGVSRDIQG